MFKRMLLYSLILAIISLVTYDVYQRNIPEDVQENTATINFRISPVYYEQSIDDYIMTSGNRVNILFYRSDSIYSKYLFDTVLTRLLNEYHLNSFTKLVYCNLDRLSSNNLTFTKNHWGFYHLPALVNLEYKEGTLTFNSVLEWNDNANLTYEQVKQFFVDNHIVTNPVAETTDSNSTSTNTKAK